MEFPSQVNIKAHNPCNIAKSLFHDCQFFQEFSCLYETIRVSAYAWRYRYFIF